MKKNLIHGTMALLFVLVVCISSAAAVDDTVTRDLPASASAGAPITVNLTVDVETGATYYGIDEIVPSGWTVTSATDGGDYTADPGHVKWAETAAADIVYSYTVEVPAAASGAYTFGGTYMFEGMTTEATILGDSTVTVGDVDTVTRDLPASASAGAPITVNLTVDVETGATYYGIDEIVPSGWNVTSATDGGDYTADPGHVKWAETAAADIVYSYTVEVPAAASGAYTFGGTYMFEGMAAEATILGDTAVTVGAAGPTLDTFTVTPVTVEQGGTVEIGIAFSAEVDWVINVNSSTATVESWDGTSTNPTVKDWVTTTATPTGTYTVDVFMNGALADTETITVTEAGVDDTVTRDLPANTSAGATITVDLAVDVKTGATYYGIDEIVPSGWTVTSATDGGNYTAETGHVKWVITAGAADKTYSYTVNVPAGASGAYTFGGTYAFEGMTAAATILGDTTLTIGVAPSITISPPSCGLIVGGMQTFTSVCKNTGGSVVTCPTLTWDSSNETVGTITSAGVFTASATGTTTITASAEGMASNDATVTVYPTGAVIVHLCTGWNLIAVPVNDPDANTAAGLASKITGCKEVVMWNVSTQMYDDPYSKIGDDWPETGFDITGGMGIFVNVESSTTVGFTGGAWS